MNRLADLDIPTIAPARNRLADLDPPKPTNRLADLEPPGFLAAADFAQKWVQPDQGSPEALAVAEQDVAEIWGDRPLPTAERSQAARISAPESEFRSAVRDLGVTPEQYTAASTQMSDVIPQPQGEPIRVGPSKIQGQGSFVTRSTKQGEPIATLFDGTNRTEAGRYVNHADEPNADVVERDGNLVAVARRDLRPDEELTIDYRQVGQRGELKKSPGAADIWEDKPLNVVQGPRTVRPVVSPTGSDRGPQTQAKGFGEAFTEHPEKFLPVVGSLLQIDNLLKVKNAARRLETGQDYDRESEQLLGIAAKQRGITPEQMRQQSEASKITVKALRDRDLELVTRWAKEAQEAKDRGYTFGGRVGQILGEMPAFMADIALTRGAFAGVKGVTKEAIERTLSASAKKGVSAAVTKGLGTVGGTVAGGVVQGGLAMPQRVVAGYAERRMPQNVQFDAEGNPEFSWPTEKPFTSFMRAWGDTAIEAVSEQSGGAVGVLGRGVGKGIGALVGKTNIGGKVLPKLYAGYKRLHPDITWSEFVRKASDRVAFHGILGELGEEYIGDQMRAVTNVDDFGAGNDADIFQRMDAAFKQDVANTPEMLAAFAVPAGGRAALSRMGRPEPGRPASAPPYEDETSPQPVPGGLGAAITADLPIAPEAQPVPLPTGQERTVPAPERPGQPPMAKEPAEAVRAPGTVVHTMPSGQVMAGPEHPGAVPGSRKVVPAAGTPGTITGFTTSKGSTYEVQPDGSTIRNKAARLEHPGEQGPQPKSDKTYYLTEEQMNLLGEVQTQGERKQVAEVPDGSGRIGVQYLSGKDAGSFERRTVIAPATEPAVGLYPLEIIKGKTEHFGNQITGVRGEPASVLPRVAETAAEVVPSAALPGPGVPATPTVVGEPAAVAGGEEAAVTEEQTVTLYHGTDEELSVQDLRVSAPSYEGSLGEGIYFGQDRQTAEFYGKNVHEVPVRITNPLVIDAGEETNYRVDPEAEAQRNDTGTYESILPGEQIIPFDAQIGGKWVRIRTAEDLASLSRRAREAGHDALIVKGIRDNATVNEEVVVFDKNQIGATPAATERGAEVSGAKEPWQMTRGEWREQTGIAPQLLDLIERANAVVRGARKKLNYAELRELQDAGYAKTVTDTTGSTIVPTEEAWKLATEHRRTVAAAVRANQPVPPEVLADYKGEPWADAALAKLGEEAGRTEEPSPSPQRPGETVSHIDRQPSELAGWAKQTQAADRNGPILVYHGTPKSFDKFELIEGSAFIYFTEAKHYAKTYRGPEGTIREHYLNVRKALNLSSIDMKAYTGFRDFIEDIKDSGDLKIAEATRKEFYPDWGRGEDLVDTSEEEPPEFAPWEVLNTLRFRQILVAGGYDAFRVTESGTKTWAIISPDQIKDRSDLYFDPTPRSQGVATPPLQPEIATEASARQRAEQYITESGERGAVISRSAKMPGKWQVTYFDSRGFSMDTTYDTKEKAQKELALENYKPSDRDLLGELSKTEAFREGNNRTWLVRYINELTSLGDSGAHKAVMDAYEAGGLDAARAVVESRKKAAPTEAIAGEEEVAKTGEREEESVPKILRENYEEWQQISRERGLTKTWAEHLQTVLENMRGYLENKTEGDITTDVLRTAKSLKSKQNIRTMGNHADITYDIWAEMPDGSKVYGRQIGPYKHGIWRPEYAGGTTLTSEQLSQQQKDARLGARLDRDINLWAMQTLMEEYQKSTVEAKPSVSWTQAIRKGNRVVVTGKLTLKGEPQTVSGEVVQYTANTASIRQADGKVARVFKEGARVEEVNAGINEPVPAGERDVLIERIVAAARSRPAQIVEKIELKGTDGKWYRGGGFPAGVRATDEKRVAGYVFFDTNGTTFGTIQPTREAAEELQRTNQESRDKEFRKSLRGMRDKELRTQESFWIVEPEAKRAATDKAMQEIQAKKEAKNAPKSWKQQQQAKLRELKAKRFKTAGDEKQIERIQKRLNENVAKWQVGQGVGWRIQGQVNRGLRIVELMPDTHEAVVQYTTDTGQLADYQQGQTQVVDTIDLVRDKQYDVATVESVEKPAPPKEKWESLRDDFNAALDQDDTAAALGVARKANKDELARILNFGFNMKRSELLSQLEKSLPKMTKTERTKQDYRDEINDIRSKWRQSKEHLERAEAMLAKGEIAPDSTAFEGSPIVGGGYGMTPIRDNLREAEAEMRRLANEYGLMDEYKAEPWATPSAPSAAQAEAGKAEEGRILGRSEPRENPAVEGATSQTEYRVRPTTEPERAQMSKDRVITKPGQGRYVVERRRVDVAPDNTESIGPWAVWQIGDTEQAAIDAGVNDSDFARTISPQEFTNEPTAAEPEEARPEPAGSAEVQPGQAVEPVPETAPSGTLDPTKLDDALKIIELHNQYLEEQYSHLTKEERAAGVSSFNLRSIRSGSELIYSAEQVEQAYRTALKPVPSPVSDARLFALPGHEKEVAALGQKMVKLPALPGSLRATTGLPKPTALPKAGKTNADAVKAVFEAAGTEPAGEGKYSNTGVYVDGKNLVATDGRRLYIAQGKWGKDGVYADRASLKKGQLGTPDPKAVFPRWDDILAQQPTDPREAIEVTNLPQMWRRVRQAATMTGEDEHGIVLVKNPDGSLGFATADPAIGQVEVNVHEGGQMLGGIDKDYLLDVLAFHARRGDTYVRLWFPAPDRPMTTRGTTGPVTNTTVTMPIRLGEAATAAAQEAISPARPQYQAQPASSIPVTGTPTAEVRQAIDRVKAKAAELGIRIESIDIVDEDRILTWERDQKELEDRGVTKEQYDVVVAKGDKFWVYGQHNLVRGSRGQRWSSKITLYAHHRPDTVYHEFGHAADVQGKLSIPGRGSEEVAQYVETLFTQGREAELTLGEHEVPTADLWGTGLLPTSETSEWGAQNTGVTRAEYEALKAKRAKRGGLKGGRQSGGTTMFDPEEWSDMVKIGRFHFEAGARQFAEWSKRVLADLGEAIKPHLTALWLAVKDNPVLNAPPAQTPPPGGPAPPASQPPQPRRPRPRAAPLIGQPLGAIAEKLESLYQNHVNRFQSIENLDKRADKLGLKKQVGERAGILARSYLGIVGKVQTTLEHNTFRTKTDGSIEVTGEGLKAILDTWDAQAKAIEPDRDQRERDIQDYGNALRKVYDLQRPKAEWSKRNIVTPQQADEQQRILDLLRAKYQSAPTLLDDVSSRLTGYRQRILHLLVDSSNMTQEEYDHLVALHPHYTPFDKILESVETGWLPKGKRLFTKARSPIKRIGEQRDDLEIANTIESDIKNTYRIMDTVDRNRVALAIKGYMASFPEDVTPVQVKMVPIKVDPAEIDTIRREFHQKTRPIIEEVRTTRQSGGTVPSDASGPMAKLETVVKEALMQRGMTEGEAGNYIRKLKTVATPGTGTAETVRIETQLRQVIRESEKIITETLPIETTIFRPSQFAPKGNVIEYFENGKRRYMEVTQNLFEAMTGLNEVSLSLLTKLLATPANLLRTGATITPEFMARNPLRDQWTALMNTQIGFRPFIDSTTALADILGQSEAYHDWLRSGGSYSGLVELSRPGLKKATRQLTATRTRRMLSRLNIITDAQDISQLMERATRVGIYKRAVAGGQTPMEAGFTAREGTIDFARRGAKMKDINAMMAFFNAGVQGFDKSVRAARADPIGFALKGFVSITLPSLILYVLNRDDDEYYDLPRWQRDLFWCIHIGDTWVRIPKSFLYGQVFGSSMERFAEYQYRQDPKAFDGLFKALRDAISPVQGDLGGGLLATAIKPLIENATNWNFFRERPIVPLSRQGLLPAQQYGRYATETAKALGEQFNYSPAKIENLVQGYFGGTGRYALEATDYLLNSIRRASGEPTPPKRPTGLSDIPLVRGFVVRPPEEGASQSLQDFYDRAERIGSTYSTWRRLITEGDSERASRLLAESPELILGQKVDEYRTEIGEYLKGIDGIVRDRNLTTEQKRMKIADIENRRAATVKKANQAIANSRLDDLAVGQWLRQLLHDNTYQAIVRPSRSNNFTRHMPGEAHKGQEDLVQQIEAELARRRAK